MNEAPIPRCEFCNSQSHFRKGAFCYCCSALHLACAACVDFTLAEADHCRTCRPDKCARPKSKK